MATMSLEGLQKGAHGGKPMIGLQVRSISVADVFVVPYLVEGTTWQVRLKAEDERGRRTLEVLNAHSGGETLQVEADSPKIDRHHLEVVQAVSAEDSEVTLTRKGWENLVRKHDLVEKFWVAALNSYLVLLAEELG